MIINVRGLSGSGKSTSVKNIMSLYPDHKVLMRHKKRPLVNRCSGLENANELIVIGPYDSDDKTTGCDVILYNEQVKLLVSHFHNLGYDVLYEGMILSTSPLPLDLANDNIPVSVLLLSVPLDVVKKQRQDRAINRGHSGELKDAITDEEALMKSFNKVCEHSLVKGLITTQDTIINDYLNIIGNEILRSVKNDENLFDLQMRFETTSSVKNSKKKLPSDLFSIE